MFKDRGNFDAAEALRLANDAVTTCEKTLESDPNHFSPRTIDSIRQLLDQAVEQAQADSAAAQNVEASPGLALCP